MFQKFVVPAVAISMVAQPALADIPPIDPAVVAVVATGCTSEHAYTQAIGQASEGRQRSSLGEAARPLQSLTVTVTPISGRVTGVELLAYYDEALGDSDARRAAAAEFMQAIDVAVQESGLFASRKVDDEDGELTFSDAADGGGVELTVSRLGVGVYVTCSSPELRALALDEMLGRTRIERPVSPDMALPPRMELATCQDPAGRAEILEGFEGAALMDFVESLQRNTNYAQALGRWYSQQLEDQGVWDSNRDGAFRQSLLNDPIVSGALEGQMGRLNQYVEGLVEYAEALDRGDTLSACRSVVRSLNVMHDIHDSNTTQWARTYELYRAEAQRLGATLED